MITNGDVLQLIRAAQATKFDGTPRDQALDDLISAKFGDKVDLEKALIKHRAFWQEVAKQFQERDFIIPEKIGFLVAPVESDDESQRPLQRLQQEATRTRIILGLKKAPSPFLEQIIKIDLQGNANQWAQALYSEEGAKLFGPLGIKDGKIEKGLYYDVDDKGNTFALAHIEAEKLLLKEKISACTDEKILAELLDSSGPLSKGTLLSLGFPIGSFPALENISNDKDLLTITTKKAFELTIAKLKLDPEKQLETMHYLMANYRLLQEPPDIDSDDEITKTKQPIDFKTRLGQKFPDIGEHLLTLELDQWAHDLLNDQYLPIVLKQFHKETLVEGMGHLADARSFKQFIMAHFNEKMNVPIEEAAYLASPVDAQFATLRLSMVEAFLSKVTEEQITPLTNLADSKNLSDFRQHAQALGIQADWINASTMPNLRAAAETSLKTIYKERFQKKIDAQSRYAHTAHAGLIEVFTTLSLSQQKKLLANPSAIQNLMQTAKPEMLLRYFPDNAPGNISALRNNNENLALFSNIDNAALANALAQLPFSPKSRININHAFKTDSENPHTIDKETVYRKLRSQYDTGISQVQEKQLLDAIKTSWDDIIQQHEYNRALMLGYEQRGSSDSEALMSHILSEKAVLDFFLKLKKDQPFLREPESEELPAPENDPIVSLLDDFKTASSRKEFIGKVIDHKPPYEGLPKNWEYALTPDVFNELKYEQRADELRSHATYTEAIKKGEEILKQIKEVKALKPLRSKLDQLDNLFLKNVENAAQYSSEQKSQAATRVFKKIFNARHGLSARRLAKEHSGFIKEMRVASEATRDNLRRTKETLNKLLNSIPKDSALDRELSEEDQANPANQHQKDALKKHEAAIQEKLDAINMELAFYNVKCRELREKEKLITEVMSGQYAKIPKLRSLASSYEDINVSEIDKHLGTFKEDDEEKEQTKFTQISSQNNENHTENDEIEDDILPGHFRKYTVSSMGTSNTVGDYLLERHGGEKNARTVITASSFPQETKGHDRENYALEVIGRLIANMDKKPSMANPIQIRGTNSDEVKLMIKAALKIGKLKGLTFGMEALNVRIDGMSNTDTAKFIQKASKEVDNEIKAETKANIIASPTTNLMKDIQELAEYKFGYDKELDKLSTVTEDYRENITTQKQERDIAAGYSEEEEEVISPTPLRPSNTN